MFDPWRIDLLPDFEGLVKLDGIRFAVFDRASRFGVSRPYGRYCGSRHLSTGAARLNGATDAEIEDAVLYAKPSAGWSACTTGRQADYEQVKKDVRTAWRVFLETPLTLLRILPSRARPPNY